MNPAFSSPTSPNLVSAIIDDRIREAAEIRLAAEVPVPDMETSHRFRRFLVNRAATSPDTSGVPAASPSR